METTPETALLNRYPGVRELVAAMPEFVAWKDALPVLEIDGETLFLIGGDPSLGAGADQPKDLDQIIVAWTNEFRPDLIGRSPGQGGQNEWDAGPGAL
jgi:hypothetical protein